MVLSHYDQKTIDEYEKRLATLEKFYLTAEERELNLFVIKIVRSVKMTLWLTNGVVKWGAAPLGIAWELYAYGSNFINGLGDLLRGIPR
ncbi:hypothetical protein OAN307_c39260 [Octadecabacter antarcticus 307]|uniref:Uncharacterized protein n=1 Tax=Octadecabacter antarcticus 307 TaxID=391626 RepID=M9RG18_9RHOB|nr:hypothetical protein OAN307_c39260 [Octadecabacter antarcticus 307]